MFGPAKRELTEIAEPEACRFGVWQGEEYNIATKHVDACLEASRDGGSNPPASILASATTMINIANELKDSLKENASDKKVAALIDETVRAIETLRSRIGKLL